MLRQSGEFTTASGTTTITFPKSFAVSPRVWVTVSNPPANAAPLVFYLSATQLVTGAANMPGSAWIAGARLMWAAEGIPAGI